VAELRGRCHKLAALGSILGRARPELGHGIRSLPHGSYIILFRYSESGVRIARILEAHRDMASDRVEDEV
jgi:toxin ParE1/3/4